MSFYIIIRGPLGSGKSTIAEKLGNILNTDVVAVDRVLDDHRLIGDKEDGYISQASFQKVNEIIAPAARQSLQVGKVVIFDGNFYWRSQLDDLIQKLDFPHYVFTLKAPLEVCIERDQQRSKPHGKDAAEAVYKKSTEFDYGTTIDATDTVDATVEKILALLPPSI